MTQDNNLYCNNKFSLWLDLFRWTAAFSVLVAHLGLVALLPYSETRSPSLMATCYSFVAGFAHQGVMVFFVISGLLVGGSFIRSQRGGTFNFGSYLLRRIVRLWIVIIPVLVMAYVLSLLSLSQFAGGKMDLYPVDAAARLTLGSFFCTLFFLQTVACPAFAFDSPLWSLASEFVYYLAFPALVLATTMATRIARIAAVLSIVAILFGLTHVQFSGSPIAPYFLVWILGAYVGAMERPRFVPSARMSALLFVVALLVTRLLKLGAIDGTPTPLQFLSDGMIAVTFSALVIGMRFSDHLIAPPLNKINHELANFSFTLYCLHYPLSLFLAAVSLHYFDLGYKMQSSEVGPQTWAFVFGYMAIIVSISWLVSLVTERQTDRVRRTISRYSSRLLRLGRNQAS